MLVLLRLSTNTYMVTAAWVRILPSPLVLYSTYKMQAVANKEQTVQGSSFVFNLHYKQTSADHYTERNPSEIANLIHNYNLLCFVFIVCHICWWFGVVSFFVLFCLVVFF